MRPSKDEYYLDIAKAVCQRSPCIRWKVGAIIVKNDVIVSSGYNGPPRGSVNCFEVGCLKDELNAPEWGAYDLCLAVHAEENAIINAARHGASVIGGTLYLHGEKFDGSGLIDIRPCDRCKRAIINAGIVRVVMRKADGSIESVDVSKWIKDEIQDYMKKLEEARRKRNG